jgi:hypothetical protein
MDPISKVRIAENSAETGKKRVGRPYPKGTSGNPGGRPKKKPITEIYEELFNDPKNRKAIKEQVFSTMSTKGMAGVLERREAAERLEGKVSESVDVNVTGRITLEQVLAARKKAGK